MFEDRTQENILSELFEKAPEGTDTRQGSIFHDAVVSASYKMAEWYSGLQSMFDLVLVMTAEGEYLDRRGAEFAVFRLPATSARYVFTWEGTEPEVGNRFFANDLFFVLRRADDGKLFLEAEMPGIGANNITNGTAAVPVNNISGLTSSDFGSLIEPGVNREEDEPFRDRIIGKIAGPSENGNRHHYKTWCESVTGVGRARIIPLFAGPNTVMGVIVGTDGLPAVQSVIERVQEYIDPMTLGKTVEVNGEIIPVGDGLGDGVANIGAHFAAVAPEGLTIDISFAAEAKQESSIEQIKADATKAITEYLKGLTLNTPERQTVIVRMSSISSILYTLPGLLDYTSLTLNGNTSNIQLSNTQIAVIGEVSVSAVI